MPRQFVRPINRSAKRKTSWLNFSAVFTSPTALAAGTSILLASLNAAALALRPFTIVRTRGMVYVFSDQSAASEEPFGALGFAVVSDEASAIGVTAVPTPTSGSGSSLWFSWTPWFASIKLGSNISIANVGSSYEFDSKAMRKVEVGQDIVAVVENQHAADGASFLFTARILIKTN